MSRNTAADLTPRNLRWQSHRAPRTAANGRGTAVCRRRYRGCRASPPLVPDINLSPRPPAPREAARLFTSSSEVSIVSKRRRSSSRAFGRPLLVIDMPGSRAIENNPRQRRRRLALIVCQRSTRACSLTPAVCPRRDRIDVFRHAGQLTHPRRRQKRRHCDIHLEPPRRRTLGGDDEGGRAPQRNCSSGRR